jgi:hypothetical protein
MYDIEMATTLRDCPQYWINFVKATRDPEEPIDHLNKVMKEFNCEWLYNNIQQPIGITFDTEEDATAFILRWS